MPAPRVSATAIRGFVDHATFDRGRDYARRGMVQQTQWDEHARTLIARVRGSRGEPYRCTVWIDAVGTPEDSVCSCPVASDCKHVVAALLVGTQGSAGGTEVVAAGQAQAAPAWRRLLERTQQGSTALALGVELRTRGAARSQWMPRPAVAAHPRDLAREPAEISLAVRPLLRSDATGRWIQTDATWDGIRRSPLRFRASQVRWFTDFIGIARESLLSGTAGDWIVLDHVGSALLWPHLSDAAGVGIPIVPTQKHTEVRFAAAADVGVIIERAGADWRVRASVTIDGRSREPASVRTIGDSGLYAWETVGAGIELVLAQAHVPGPARTLLAGGGSVPVPAVERDGFLTDGYPVLARATPIVAGEGVELPIVPDPVPLLTVTFAAGHRLECAWGWEYPGHGAFPLTPSGDAVRDDALEQRLLEGLRRVWRECTGTDLRPTASLDGFQAAEFVSQTIARLETEGVRVQTRGTPRTYRELSGEPEITVTTVDSPQRDWFDLGVLVRIDGRSIPFQELFTALSMRRKKMMLVDGSWFSLAHPALQRLRDLLDEAAGIDEWESGPRISRQQIALWEEFEDLADQALPAVSWRATVEGLRSATGVPSVEVPAGLRAQLRPYQRAGYEWLAFLWKHRLGGILADDMGLGKTVQVLALLQHLRESGERRPVLVIAPTSVLSTWRDEAARFAPDLRVLLRDATSAKGGSPLAEHTGDHDVIVTSYTLLRLDEAEYADVEWAAVVLDEAQFVKNPATRQHRSVAALHADAVYAITGTPMENTLAELWALLKLTAPGLFPSARTFRQEYIQPIEQGKVPENEEGSEYRRRRLERLRRRIRPLMLRRTKDLVAVELPPKQEQVLQVELSAAHRARYDTVLQRERQKVLGLLDDLDRNRFIVFRSLTLLRMLALAPGLIEEQDTPIGSSKLDLLVERASELAEEGHRALVFSQFTSYLRMAADRLERAGIPYAYLDGSTRDRARVVDAFRQGDQPVFLISLKAGGFGLTLTEADYVFMLDPWWNPAAEAQAIDRTHRIGQASQVLVYRMIAADTIEEKVLELQRRKARLFTAVMDDEELFAQTITADDIRGLLER